MFPKVPALAVVKNAMLFIHRWGYAKDKPQTPAVYGTWAEQSKQLTLQNKFPLLDLILDFIQLNHGTWLRRTHKETLARYPLQCVYLGAHLKIYMVIFGMSFLTTYWHIMAWLRSESNQIWRWRFPITPDKPLPFPPSEGLIRQHVDLSFLSLAVFISLHRGMTSLWFAISLCISFSLSLHISLSCLGTRWKLKDLFHHAPSQAKAYKQACINYCHHFLGSRVVLPKGSMFSWLTLEVSSCCWMLVTTLILQAKSILT